MTGQGRAHGAVGSSDPLRHLRHAGRAHAELAHSQANQKGQHRRVGGRVTADRDVHSGRPRRLHHPGDQGQHPRVCRQGRAHRRIGPVQAEHLAGQVVGADREEVARAGERVRRGSGGGDFHHHAELGHVGAGLGGGVRQRRPHQRHLLQGAHHRHHDAQLGIPAGAQHRTELIA